MKFEDINKDPVEQALVELYRQLKAYKNQNFSYLEAIKTESSLKAPASLPPEIIEQLSAYTSLTTVGQMAGRVYAIIGQRGLELLDKPEPNQ